jgi:hypothetical protein
MKARTLLTLALVTVAAGVAVGLALGLSSMLGRFRLFEKDVSDRFVVYIEGTSPSGKLVLLQGVERFTASREFTAKILSLLKIEAKIDISALADTAYYVDLADASRWKASWSARTGRLRITAPAPDLLPPAVRTDTIEVRTTGANILSSTIFQLKKEAETLRSELSADMLQQGRKALASAELRSRISSSLEATAKGFCSAILHITPRSVEVVFAEE